ncbi:MAG: excinuclease ABC subunit C, partial [Candidatus Sericytochromatia bacterium]
VFLPNEKDSIIMPDESYSLKLLQHVRDESHRFAITFHRDLRGKKMVKSILDDIKGIGTVRKKELIEKFGSIGNLKELSLEQLITKAQLPKKVAEDLFSKLHS